MPAPSGFLTALGQMFQGYGIDQSRRDAQDEKDQLRQATTAQTQAKFAYDQERTAREDALKGIRQGTAPNQGLITGAAQMASGFAGPAASIGLSGAMQDNPEQFDANRFQQVTPSSYLDRANTPDALSAKKQEIAARLQAVRDAQRQDFQTKQAQQHEAFLQAQQERAQAAADRRAAGGQKDHFTMSNSIDPATGHPYILNTSSGEMTVGQGTKPVTTAGGAQQQKAQDYADLMKNALPVMQELQGKVRPWAVSLALKNPTMGNAALTKDEQRYIAAGRDYLAGVLHAESGSRLTHEQIQFGQSRYLPTFGDEPSTTATKLQNAQRTFEDRMRNAHPGSALSPSPAAPQGKAPMTERIQQLKAQGLSKEAAKAQLQQEGYAVDGGE